MFTDYCKKRMDQRNITHEDIINCLKKNKDLYFVQFQKRYFMGLLEKRYKLVYKISSRYSLIIVVSYYPKILKVINTIKTSKGAFKEWENNILK